MKRKMDGHIIRTLQIAKWFRFFFASEEIKKESVVRVWGRKEGMCKNSNN